MVSNVWSGVLTQKRRLRKHSRVFLLVWPDKKNVPTSANVWQTIPLRRQKSELLRDSVTARLLRRWRVDVNDNNNSDTYVSAQSL